MPTELSLLQTFTFTIKSDKAPVVFAIQDPDEGDMRFFLHLKHVTENEESVTSISCPDKFTANILVKMRSDERAMLDSPIKVGSYRKHYALYMNFDLSPIDADDEHSGTLSFFIKSK